MIPPKSHTRTCNDVCSVNFLSTDTSSQFAQAATQATDQLATVTSLVVTRNGGNVASVTTVTPAHALTDPNLTVSGSLGGGVAG